MKMKNKSFNIQASGRTAGARLMPRAAMMMLLLLASSATMWAVDNGPWTWYGQRSGHCNFWNNYSISYNGLNNTHWQNLWSRQYSDRFGAFVGIPWDSEDKNAVYTIFYHTENVPSYTRRRLTSKYIVKQGFSGTTAWQTTALYARDDVNALKAMSVDFTDGGSDGTGKAYCLHRITLYNPTTQVDKSFSDSFDFDNRNSSSAQSKTWALMMTHVVAVHNYEVCEGWSEFWNDGYMGHLLLSVCHLRQQWRHWLDGSEDLRE